MALRLKEGLVECATLCVKNEVILMFKKSEYLRGVGGLKFQYFKILESRIEVTQGQIPTWGKRVVSETIRMS